MTSRSFLTLVLSYIAICPFWVLPIWPPTASIAVASIQQVAITRSILSTEISSRLQVFTISIFGPKRYCVGGGFPMLSMWVVDFVPTILVKIVTTPRLILALILILYAILESLCHVSHLAICRLWVLSTVVSIQQVEITRSILFTEISCRLQVLTMLLALLFGPEKYCVGGSRGGYIQFP